MVSSSIPDGVVAHAWAENTFKLVDASHERASIKTKCVCYFTMGLVIRLHHINILECSTFELEHEQEANEYLSTF